jgi:hypothetical protein
MDENEIKFICERRAVSLNLEQSFSVKTGEKNKAIRGINESKQNTYKKKFINLCAESIPWVSLILIASGIITESVLPLIKAAIVVINPMI